MNHPIVQMDHLQEYDSSISHAEMLKIIRDHEIMDNRSIYETLGYKPRYSLYQVYIWLGYR